MEYFRLICYVLLFPLMVSIIFRISLTGFINSYLRDMSLFIQLIICQKSCESGTVQCCDLSHSAHASLFDVNPFPISRSMFISLFASQRKHIEWSHYQKQQKSSRSAFCYSTPSFHET